MRVTAPNRILAFLIQEIGIVITVDLSHSLLNERQLTAGALPHSASGGNDTESSNSIVGLKESLIAHSSEQR